jgi:peroxiredoxin
VFCRQQVAELAERHTSFSDNQARLVIIGSGDVAHLKELREVSGYRGDLLTDPSRESFRLLGFTSGVGGLMGLKAISRGFSALRAGFTPGAIQGSALQLGGAIIVNQDGTIRYFYRSKEAGDHPAVDDMLAALG